MVELKLKLNNQWVDKSQFVQLPINITQSIDETMDRGEVVLNFTQDSVEYEPYSFALLKLDGKEFYMMVESDTVEEIQNGLDSYFRHELVLIEATQYLATLDLNDFATTQLVEFYEDLPYSDRVVLNTMVDSDKFWQFETEPFRWRQTGSAFTYQEELVLSSVHGGIYKVALEVDNTQVNRSYSKILDSFISLPKITDARFSGRIQGRSLGILILDSEQNFDLGYDEFIIHSETGTVYNVSSLADSAKRINLSLLPVGSYRYKIRTKLSYWDVPSNTTKLNSNALLGGPKWIEVLLGQGGIFVRDYISEGGLNRNTDYIKEIEYSFFITDSTTKETFNITVADVLLRALNNIKARKLYDARYYKEITQSEFNSLPGTAYTGSSAFIVGPIEKFGPASGYDYGSKFSLSVVSPSFTQYFKIESRIVDGTLPNIEKYDSSFNSRLFYTKPLELKYDSDILERASTITSLDFTFAGGRNLLEVLFELGKTLGGIPRVYFDSNLNPVISFDILEELIQNPLFVDTPVLTRKSASTSSYATNVISEVKNFIAQDDLGLKSTNTIVYPSKSSWVTPRAINFDDAIMKPDTMSLSIDDPNHGIFKIVKLEVTNFNDANTVLDITDYVHEKTVFDTFENALQPSGSTSKNYKAIALYYERGSNQILNMNEILDEDNIFGITGSKYNIERIILNKLNIQLSGDKTQNEATVAANITKPKVTFQYRVEYVPIVKSARLFVEQSNVTLENQSINMPYNQTERNVSLSQFFQAADNTLKRNGIPSINKSYNFTTVDQVPLLGERIDFNGYYYYADKISFSYDNNNILCDVQFSRDVNKVDPVVGFNKQYREYSLISDDILWKRMNINNYGYITGDLSFVNRPNREFDSSKAILPQSFVNLINGTFASSLEKIEAAVFNFYDKDGNPIRWDFNFNKVKPVGLSIVSAAAGNSLMFSASMYDNFSAGRKMVKIPYDQSNVIDALSNLIVSDGQGNEKNRLSQDYVRYVDDNGNVAVAKMLFLKRSDTTSFNPLNVPELQDGFEEYAKKAVLEETFFLDKDNREALQLTYQLHFVSRDKDIEVRPAFTKYNKLVTQTSELPVQPENLIVVGIRNLDSLKSSKTYDYDSNDVLVSSIGASFFASPQNYIGLIPSGLTSTKNVNYEGYALVFPGTKEIAIIRRRPISLGSTIGSIYIAFSEEVL